MRDAEFYTRSNQLQFKEAELFLSRCRKEGLLEFEDDEHVLDVGCGPGDLTTRLLLPLLPDSTHLIGVDLLEEMVDYATHHFSRKNVVFKQANLETPNMLQTLNTSKFDKIFSFHCLHWIKNQRLAFENLSNLLKEGGTMYIVFIAESNLNQLNEILLANPKWQQHLKVLEDFSPKLNVQKNLETYFRALLLDCKLDVSVCNLVQSSFTFHSLHHLSEVVVGVHPAVKEMSGQVLQEFKKDIKKTVVENKLGRVDVVSGQVTATHNIFSIVATKPNYT